MCVGAARICHHVPLSHLGFAGACLCRPLAEDLSICLILPDLFAMTKVRARIATQGQGESLGKPIPKAVPAANVIGLAAARARLATQGLGESLGEPIPKAAPADARRVVLVPRAALMNAPESVLAHAHDGVHGLDGCSDDDSSSESVSKAWRRRGRERLGPRQLSNSPPPVKARLPSRSREPSAEAGQGESPGNVSDADDISSFSSLSDAGQGESLVNRSQQSSSSKKGKVIKPRGTIALDLPQKADHLQDRKQQSADHRMPRRKPPTPPRQRVRLQSNQQAASRQTGALPAPAEEYWKWHYDSAHDRWVSKGQRVGSLGGGRDTVPGKHAAKNATQKRRKRRRLEERVQEDWEDPDGAAARAWHRTEYAAKCYMKHQFRMSWLGSRCDSSECLLALEDKHDDKA